MIDWWWVFTNAWWVLGTAVFLAALSYASWEASWMQIGWWKRLSDPGYQFTIHLSLLLICAGAGANEARTWLQVAWLVLGLAFGSLAVVDGRALRRARKQPPVN